MAEIAAVTALLRDPEQRLLTITGPGGIGKTRLGLAVAHGLAADHPDGVWFVPLDPLHDHRLVAGAIADVLEVEVPAGDVLPALKAHLRDLRLLLVLDNFEQVEDAAPVVSELLAAAPGLRVLVTSRIRLRLYGERVVPLDPLAPADAVPLFVERARSVDRMFDAPPDTVAELCEQLDGIPLAIELVAARADEVPLEVLRKQLANRQALDLATDGPRDRSSRQRTLRDAIAWSVALLPDAAGRTVRTARCLRRRLHGGGGGRGRRCDGCRPHRAGASQPGGRCPERALSPARDAAGVRRRADRRRPRPDRRRPRGVVPEVRAGLRRARSPSQRGSR